MVLIHSAKGSTWKHHKYVKKVDGTYYYPGDYKGGNNSVEGSGGVGGAFDEKDYETIAHDVLDGKFGNGDVRKTLLGEDYQQVQDMVNRMLNPNSSEPELVNGKKKAEKKITKEEFDQLQTLKPIKKRWYTTGVAKKTNVGSKIPKTKWYTTGVAKRKKLSPIDHLAIRVQSLVKQQQRGGTII